MIPSGIRKKRSVQPRFGRTSSWRAAQPAARRPRRGPADAAVLARLGLPGSHDTVRAYAALISFQVFVHMPSASPLNASNWMRFTISGSNARTGLPEIDFLISGVAEGIR